MELNEIYYGDAYELIKQIDDKSIDLIITDPPYEFTVNDYNAKFFRNRKINAYKDIKKNNINKGIDYSILNEFVRVLKKINCYIWCNKEQIFNYLQFFTKEHNCNFEIIVWGKINPPPLLGGHFLADKEYCLYFWERGVKMNTTYDIGKTVYYTTLNQLDKKQYLHPTIKPLNIIENLVKYQV